MRRVAPAARVAIVLDTIAKLRLLQREMTRLSPRDEDYQSNHRALQTAIRELQEVISRNVQ